MIGEAILQSTTLADVTNLILKKTSTNETKTITREIARLAKDE